MQGDLVLTWSDSVKMYMEKMDSCHLEKGSVYFLVHYKWDVDLNVNKFLLFYIKSFWNFISPKKKIILKNVYILVS